MLLKQVSRGLALTLGTAALFSAVSLHADLIRSSKISIPFEFMVQHRSLPAGDYWVEQATGSEVAVLVNVKTGQRVEILRPTANHEPGKTRLEFKSEADGQHLKKIT